VDLRAAALDVDSRFRLGVPLRVHLGAGGGSTLHVGDGVDHCTRRGGVGAILDLHHCVGRRRSGRSGGGDGGRGSSEPHRAKP
jgi:hypothetical protein